MPSDQWLSEILPWLVCVLVQEAEFRPPPGPSADQGLSLKTMAEKHFKFVSKLLSASHQDTFESYTSSHQLVQISWSFSVSNYIILHFKSCYQGCSFLRSGDLFFFAAVFSLFRIGVSVQMLVEVSFSQALHDR